MTWQERESVHLRTVPDDIVDLAYRIDCPHLPLDHAYVLSQALQQALPWLEKEESAGLHLIHVAGSGNGWMRPENTRNATLQLSKRTRLYLRLPKARVTEAQQLTGQVLDIGGHSLIVGESSIKPLGYSSTLFARYVLTAPEEQEQQFTDRQLDQLETMGVRVKKILCGKHHEFYTPEGEVTVRSLMLAELSFDESIKLQQTGLGPKRRMGLGLFIPHKGIAPVMIEE